MNCDKIFDFGSKRPVWLDIVLIASVACVLLLSLVNVPVGLPGVLDESYQALCVRNFAESPMAMLTFWMGNVWTALFDDGFLALRYLNWTVSLLAVAVGCCYLWRVTGYWRVACGMFVSAMLAGMMSRTVMFNWDGGVYLFFAISELAALVYLRHRRLAGSFLLGTAVMLVGLARVPAVVLVPVAGALVWIFQVRGHRRVTGVGMYVAGLVVAFILASTLMCGSPAAYFDAFRDDNIITGHGIDDISRWIGLFTHFFAGSLTVWLPLMVSVGVGVMLGLSKRRHHGLVEVMLFGLVILVGVACAILYTPSADVMGGVGPLTAVVMVFVLLFVPVHNMCSTHPIDVPVGMMAVLSIWFVVPVIGSDVWFLRPLAYYQLPFAMAVILPAVLHHRRICRIFIKIFLVCTCCVGAMCATRCTIRFSCPLYEIRDYPGCAGVMTRYWSIADRQNVRHIYDSALGSGARGVNIDGERYFFSYCLQQSPVTNLHEFHIGNDDHGVGLRRRVAPQYDGWMFVWVDKEAYGPSIEMLRDEGFEVVYDDSCGNTAGTILMLRQSYARRWLESFGVCRRMRNFADPRPPAKWHNDNAN